MLAGHTYNIVTDTDNKSVNNKFIRVKKWTCLIFSLYITRLVVYISLKSYPLYRRHESSTERFQTAATILLCSSMYDTAFSMLLLNSCVCFVILTIIHFRIGCSHSAMNIYWYNWSGQWPNIYYIHLNDTWSDN
jgi:hypothetical protein